MDELIRTLASLALHAPASRFVPLQDGSLPPQVNAESAMWCGRFFAREADPHVVAGVKRSAHVAEGDFNDLIRHEYSIKDLRIQVTESRNYVAVVIEPASGSFKSLAADERKKFANRSAGVVLNLADEAHRWDVDAPGPLDEGKLYSTNPSVHPFQLSTWTDRMDWGVMDDRLFFLLFKRRPEIYGFLNGMQWFDDDFRAKMTRP